MAKERSKNREENQAMEPRQQGHLSRMEPWPAFSPFSTMRRFFDDIDRMFEGWVSPTWERGSWTPWTASEGFFSPHVDAFERDGKFVITADLPGIKREDVRVDVTDDAVLIEGERKHEYEKRDEGVFRSERSYGQFRRQIPLPQGLKTDTATANFRNGVLEITIDAPQLAKNRRRIQIQEEGSQRAA